MENNQDLYDNQIGGIDIKYYETYFDLRKEYYLTKLSDFENGKRNSFNIGAFLFGFIWFIYRRLYIYAILIFSFILIESWIEQWFIIKYNIDNDYQILISLFWLIIISIFLGIRANYYFLKQSKLKVTRILDLTEDENERLKMLKKAGKSNWILVLIVVIVFIILISIGH